MEQIVPPRANGIELHGPAEFEAMRKAGRLAAETLDFIVDYVEPGVTTEALDDLCHEFITARGAVPAPLGYRGYPKSTCISINHEVCHGIPNEKKLRDGDIANIDVTVILDGWHGDSSRMYPVGNIRVKQQKLIDGLSIVGLIQQPIKLCSGGSKATYYLALAERTGFDLLLCLDCQFVKKQVSEM